MHSLNEKNVKKLFEPKQRIKIIQTIIHKRHYIKTRKLSDQQEFINNPYHKCPEAKDLFPGDSTEYERITLTWKQDGSSDIFVEKVMFIESTIRRLQIDLQRATTSQSTPEIPFEQSTGTRHIVCMSLTQKTTNRLLR
jgi:hypothetical protein